MTSRTAKSSAPSPPDLADVEAVARFLDVPLNTLYQWRTKGYGPPAIKVGRHLRYRWNDVESWLDERAAAGQHPQRRSTASGSRSRQ